MIVGPFSTSSVKMDSARQNLASSFVNGFVNAAFGKDKLLTEDGNNWIYKHNDHGMNILAEDLIFFLAIRFSVWIKSHVFWKSSVETYE